MNVKEAEALYHKYFAAVYSICFLYMKNEADACDMVQETFLQLLQGRFTYQSQEKTKAWLIVTASNCCKKQLRKSWRKKQVAYDAALHDRGKDFLHFDDSGNYHLKNVKRTLSYPMYNGQAEGQLTLHSNLETLSYRLVGEGSPSPNYEPKYLYVSKLSYGLMGINKGVYRVTYNYDCKGYVSEHLDEYELDLVFTMKDGSKINVAEYGTTIFSPAVGNPEFDLRIAAGFFNKKEDPENSLKNATIHPEDLAGLEINGIHYNLVPES